MFNDFFCFKYLIVVVIVTCRYSSANSSAFCHFLEIGVLIFLFIAVNVIDVPLVDAVQIDIFRHAPALEVPEGISNLL